MDLIRYRGDETSRAISKLVPVLTGEVKLLSGNQLAGGKRSDMMALKWELETLGAFVRNAEAKSEEDNVWLVQLMEVAELLEHLHRALPQKKLTSFLLRAARWIGVLNSRNDRASNLQIQNITTLLRAINERGQAYKLLSYEIDDGTVGLKLPSEELVQRLTGGGSRRSVISLVGMGGVGKTTLSWKVFTCSQVRRCFDCFAWISVTQPYDFDNILRTLARTVGLDRTLSMALPELIEALRSRLSSEVRYLFVFDDVWDDAFWEQIKPVLPDKEKGSRVIVTTRSNVVARRCNETRFDHVQELRVLSIEDSLILFRSRVFGSSSCPHEELTEVSYEIVKICSGLPLAIVALAGVVSRLPKTVSEWEKVLHELRHNPKPEPRGIYEVMRHSFNSLPYNLKLCFLYFGMLPEDFIIPNGRLVRLWIAEGFIEEKHGRKTMEQVAKEYLNELVCASLVIEHEGFSHLHDLVFDFARHMCDKFNFPRYLSISRQESSFPRYRSISELLQDRLEGSVQSTSNVFWRNLHLSFPRSDEVVDFVPRSSSSSNGCISDDHVDTGSRCSSSSNRCISEDDYDI